MTLTIELPEDIAAKLENVPEGERQRLTVALLRRELGISGYPSPTPEELAQGGYADLADFEDACAKIAEGVADAEAGRTLSLEEARAEWATARDAWRNRQRGTQAA